MKNTPLIMLSNDDGIDAPGLQAAAQALLPIADLLIAAPAQQQSGTGRSYRIQQDAVFQERQLDIDGQRISGWCLDASPASTVNHGLLCLTGDRKPDLVVCGINLGENLGTDTTASGTVGAAMQAAIWGYKAIAVSLEASPEFHFNHGEVDWTQVKAVLRKAVEKFIAQDWPHDVDVIKIDVPENAVPSTPWQYGRQARQPGWSAIVPNAHPGSSARDIIPRRAPHLSGSWEENTDCQLIVEKKHVAITPLSIDLTSRVTQQEFEKLLSYEISNKSK